MTENEQHIINKIEICATANNFMTVVTELILRDFAGTLEALGKERPKEALNYYEAAMLVGKWLKVSSHSANAQLIEETTTNELTKLLVDLHQSILTPADKRAFTGNAFREAYFYASTSAYDFQFTRMLPRKYEYDRQWIAKHTEVGLNEFQEYFKFVKARINYKIRREKRKRRYILNGTYTYQNPFIFSEVELHSTNPNYRKITKLFTCQLGEKINENFNLIGDENKFVVKPIVHLPDGTYFIPIPYFLAESMYQSPFYWMITDADYKATSLTNRGKAAEKIVFELFKNVYSDHNTYRGIKITRDKRTTVSDIDILAIYHETAIVVQVKSKKLTSLSRQGNIESIHSDFGKAIENAYIQGKTCKEAITNKGKYDFISEDGSLINEELQQVKNTIVVCMNMDSFPSLIYANHILLFEKHAGYLVCFDIFDFEAITSLASRASDLTNFLIYRTANSRNLIAENELNIFGFVYFGDMNSDYMSKEIDRKYGSKIDEIYYTKLLNSVFLRPKTKPGRNTLCFCGSMEHFKNCHGSKY